MSKCSICDADDEYYNGVPGSGLTPNPLIDMSEYIAESGEICQGCFMRNLSSTEMKYVLFRLAVKQQSLVEAMHDIFDRMEAVEMETDEITSAFRRL